MRNWPQTLRPASWKGVGFFVDDEALPKSGRFVARHSFVKGESHSTEDMGRVPRDFRLAAYLASDTADQDARDFVDLCSEAGAGALILPMLGPVQVRCTNCHVKAKTRDKQGYIELELDFIEAGTADADGFPAAALGDRLAAASLASLPDAADARLSALDTTARQDAIERRLDPSSSLNADAAQPAVHDYEGSKADQAARDDAFQRAFALAGS
jgi:prophage DNA circulation protein